MYHVSGLFLILLGCKEAYTLDFTTTIFATCFDNTKAVSQKKAKKQHPNECLYFLEKVQSCILLWTFWKSQGGIEKC